ncbi:hypothetical protein Poly30_09740 [Planctomycetes bacterium Poly30]|uniref:Uncharacterized protein n=1 Tax=Saltatorellus ferox TaxID=2528018 RepID=A0A518EN14_9BACT|nr:hypothetical protein Poly30_09740 [Planctomycetes bacterium Poly30]
MTEVEDPMTEVEDDERWEVMRLPEIAVEDFLKADDPLSYQLASTGTAAPSPVIARSTSFDGQDDEAFDAIVQEAARLFRRAESHMNDRLGPGQSVEIDEASWTPSGLPTPVLQAAHCTMSLVSAWDLPGGGWCVLEVHQQDRDRPIELLLHTVPG